MANGRMMNPRNLLDSSPCFRQSLVVLLTLHAVIAQASQNTEFDSLVDQATRNYSTRIGRQYSNRFEDAMTSSLGKAMTDCLSRPDTVEPADIVFIVSADGHVKKVLSSNVDYARCVASAIKLPTNVPKPPRDSWAVAIGLANHSHAEKYKGPPDKPVGMKTGNQLAKYDEAIAPYVAKARATYPAAKRRFLAGLPPGHRFSVRIRLLDRHGKVEDAFIGVETIKGGTITGIIDSRLDLVTDYKTGQRMSFPESKIDNWLILRPDGTEEGNAVGKFLDTYKPK